MLNNLKGLVFVLTLALLAFRVARPVCLQFMTAEAFERRRNSWLLLTAVAFVSPQFWVFALFEFFVIAWLNRREENPLNIFFLLVFVIPNIRYYIPAPLVNQFFDLNQYRILSLAVLFPTAIRIYKRSGTWGPTQLGILDILMLAYVLIQLVIPIPYESVTNTMRRAFLLFLDTTLVVYAFQRIQTQKQLAEVLACFWLAVALMAPIAIFEAGKGWLVYNGLSDLWGDPNPFNYVYRAGSLRAQVSTGNSIALGYILSAALGVFLFLARPKLPRYIFWLVVAVFSAALVTTGSRGALVTAMIQMGIFAAFRPNAGKRFGTAVATGALIVGVMYFSPLKESVLDRLPVIGTVDQDTIAYRQQLLDVSWKLIKQNPFFGDPFVVDKLESLRQGQGIIDLVNGYIYVSLFYGIVTLAFLVGSFFIASYRCFFAFVAVRRTNEPRATMGVSLFSIFAAALFFIGTAGVNSIHIIIMGLLVSYARSSSTVEQLVRRPTFSRSQISVHVNRV